MLNYIYSELYRIFNKKSVYIYYGILFVLFTVMLLFIGGLSDLDGNGLMQFVIIILQSVVVFFIGIQAFLTVYSDDLSAKTLPNIIASNVSRTTLVFSKLIISIIYLAVVYVVCGIFITGIYIMVDGGFAHLYSGLQPLFPYAIVSLLNTLGMMSIASVFVYLLQKSALSTTLFVVLISGMIPSIIGLLISVNKIFETIYKGTFTYITSQGYSHIGVSGSIGTAFFIGLACYIALSSVFAMVAFNQGEVKGE